ncbi:MAG: FkbM family methyltransferase, partial [Verrucomicrobia bacterium]|nr:FkbM family methyltransferase [Verrucomicrobiota bacterium]
RHFRKTHGIRVKAFLLPDDDWRGHYRLKHMVAAVFRRRLGWRFYQLDDLKPDDSPALVMYGFKGFEVWQSLRLAQSGFRHVMFPRDPEYGRSFRCEPDFLHKYEASLDRLFDRLQDDESRLTLASAVRHRLDGGEEWLRLAAYRQYDHPVVKARPGDVVLDVGAEDGADSLMFSSQVGTEGRVYAFEPDPANREKLGLALDAKPNIIMVPLALGEAEAEVRFISQKSLSHIARPDEEGGMAVRVVSVDQFVRESNLQRVDLIKLDTEGYEVPILKGAAETIRKFKPKLQVSVYHKQQGRDDLADVPDLISGLEPSYRYFLGHHGSWGNETILYATCAGP